jgi:hypothetical protein
MDTDEHGFKNSETKIKPSSSVSIRTTISKSVVFLRKFLTRRNTTPYCSAGFQTCWVADFQIGRASEVVGLAG